MKKEILILILIVLLILSVFVYLENFKLSIDENQTFTSKEGFDLFENVYFWIFGAAIIILILVIISLFLMIILLKTINCRLTASVLI